MAPRSQIEQLPDVTRAELDKRLVQSAFGGYEMLSQWLSEQGFAISKSSIHRYGSKFEERLGALKLATEQAKAIATAAEDDGNAMSEALIRLTQEKAFSVLMDLEVDASEVSFDKLGTMVAKLSSASVQVKKQILEVRDRVDAKIKKMQEEAEASEKAGKGGGLSPETLKRVREEIYGLMG
jgi:hypothetical protein